VALQRCWQTPFHGQFLGWWEGTCAGVSVTWCSGTTVSMDTAGGMSAPSGCSVGGGVARPSDIVDSTTAKKQQGDSAQLRARRGNLFLFFSLNDMPLVRSQTPP
jgi:hypothetical protein